ncbi:hypothetical protein SDC9_210469 [bioreactor metagenome]|uniref:Uncharacterized protein n=1 Tax=bioreactor metagenome TaxID=1076179 RepID=A0A645JGZ8_9ZZZZ
MMHQAWALTARDGALDIFFTVAHGKAVAHRFDGASKRDGRKVRAKIFRAVILDAPDNLDARIRRVHVDAHVGKVLVVF